MCVDQFAEFCLNRVLLFDRYESDFSPTGLECFQSFDIFIRVACQLEVAHLFNQGFLEFQILHLIGIQVFCQFGFSVKEIVTSGTEGSIFYWKPFLARVRLSSIPVDIQ